jgi:hypothetical protein
LAARTVFLASSAALLCALAIACLSGLGASGAWSPGGPDAPEPPLSAFWPLWFAVALALGFAGAAATGDRTAWHARSLPALVPAIAAAAGFLLLTDLTGHALLTSLSLAACLALAFRALARLADSAPPRADLAHSVTRLAANVLAAAGALSLAATLPSLYRGWASLSPTDSPWLSFWIFALSAAGLTLIALRFGANRWFLLALLFGAAATMRHNWTVSGLHATAFMTAALSLWPLLRMTRAAKRPKPAA